CARSSIRSSSRLPTGSRPARSRRPEGGTRIMVNFSPSEEQELLRQTLSSFTRDVVRPEARDADEKNAVPEGLPAKGWELGLVQDAIPEAFGGYGSAPSAVS